MLLFLLLVAVTSVRAGQCPVSCKCKDYPRDNLSGVYTTVLCDGDLNITTSLPENTSKIVLHDVLESDLNYVIDYVSNNIANIPYFHHFAVTSSDLTELSNVTFEDLPQLTTLELTNSNIKNLIFENQNHNFSLLTTLDLSQNVISELSNETFRTFPSLEVLNLSANSIDKFSANTFNGLTALKCLDLSENNINSIDDSVFLPLVSLQYLNLSRNHLEVLNEACFSSLLHLQQLDVSWNKLARVAPGSLELPSLSRLLLAGNPQLGGSKEPTLLVGTGRRLQSVDASQTGLKQVPAALTHSIRTLRLAGNSINLVKCGDLDSYPLLQLLDFTSNTLEKIEDDALGRLDSLKVLYLSENKLKIIPKSLPEHLQILHLENNEIEEVSREDFEGLLVLEVLHLNNNKIKTIREGAFTFLESLATLDLSSNPVSTFPAGSLSGPRELRVLRLSNIELISPANDMTFPLSTPERLITLDLSNSPGLCRQFLADTATLAAARELQELNLSGGGLNHIRPELLHFLPQVRRLQLDNNPLNCTDLHWLAIWMRRQDEEGYRKVVCASPSELWGTQLVDLQEIENEPNYETTTQSIRLTSTVSSNINIYDENKLNNSILKENSTKINSSDSRQTAIFGVPAEISAYNASGSVTILPKLSGDDEVSSPLNLIKTDVISRPGSLTRENGKEIINGKEKYTNNTGDVDGLLRVESKSVGVRKNGEKGNERGAAVIEENFKSEASSLDIITEKATEDSTFHGKVNRIPSGKNSTITNVAEKVSGVNSSTDILHNLFIVSKGRALNKKVEKIDGRERHMNEIYSEDYVTTGDGFKGEGGRVDEVGKGAVVGGTEISDKHRPHHSENVTKGEMSMYSGKPKDEGFNAHPGMLILAIGILGASVAVALLTSRIARQHRNRLMARQQDIEVSSLPSVTELW